MKDSFVERIFLLVFLGIALVSFSVSSVVLHMSKNAFKENYGRSQKKVFGQIQDELDDLHMDILRITEQIESSWAFRAYLNDENWLDNVSVFQIEYQMEMDLTQANSSGIDRMNILVVGKSGKSFLSRTEQVILSNDKIWKSKAVQKAVEKPDQIHYTYSRGAYTSTSRDSDVIIVSKALYYHETMDVYGVVLVTLSMDDLRSYYDFFVSDFTDWYLIDSDNIIMCSNQSKGIGGRLQELWYDEKQDYSQDIWSKNDGRLTILIRDLSYQRCRMVGVIDHDLALDNLYNMPVLVGICFAIEIITMISCLVSVLRLIKPMQRLVAMMSDSRKENFTKLVPVEGTVEIQNLARTYNEMLKDIQNYIQELLETQKEKRQVEMKALQMQINPHFIYNTLAGMKWLVYQGNVEKTVQVIDAFVSLLRSTINNTNEFITVNQERENLENYVFISHARYGDFIKVEYFITPDCEDCLLPNMILQPFLENAFLHAFPAEKEGFIQIFINQKEERLFIRMIDNGTGMVEEQCEQDLSKKKEQFSGIGIHNTRDRLQLIYGDFCKLSINSQKNRGTTVKIELPVQRRVIDEL